MAGILIIEDEQQSAERLENLIHELAPSFRVLAKLESVRQSVSWLKHNPLPALILMDIHLADGISFEIFDQAEITCPVIFTTAYDEYALKAFKVNSIDYLLKPIDSADLKKALDKYYRTQAQSTNLMQSVTLAMEMLTKKYKSRFVIKVGEHLRSVEVPEILFFYSLDRATFAQTKDARRNIIDFTLDQLEGILDPNRFFRISRKYIVANDSIQDMITHTNSRLKLILKTSDDKDVIVARERVQDFKNWLDQ